MSISARTRLYRFTAVMGVLAFVLIGLAGTPPAAALRSDDMGVTASYQIDIHKDETVDITVTVDIEDVSPSMYCTKDLKDSMKVKDQPNAAVDVSPSGDQCVMTLTGVDIDSMKEDESLTIRHKGGKYIFTASDFSSAKDIDTTMSVTFPGKATKADDKAQIDGNTVTWSDLGSLSSINAEGRDSPGPSWTSIIVGVLAVLVIGGGIAAAVVLTIRKKKQAGVPAGIYSQPGQADYTQGGYAQPGYQPGQPGYQPGQPGYAQPGTTDYPQPGQPAQPGYQPAQPGYAQPGTTDYPQPGQPGQPAQPAQPGQPGQPGQQPYYPNSQY